MWGKTFAWAPNLNPTWHIEYICTYAYICGRRTDSWTDGRTDRGTGGQTDHRTQTDGMIYPGPSSPEPSHDASHLCSKLHAPICTTPVFGSFVFYTFATREETLSELGIPLIAKLDDAPPRYLVQEIIWDQKASENLAQSFREPKITCFHLPQSIWWGSLMLSGSRSEICGTSAGGIAPSNFATFYSTRVVVQNNTG